MVRALLAVVTVGVLYLALTFVQVWLASRQDQARPVQAIVVLGAAQYNGVPSPDLKARLDHAFDLYQRHLADTVVVTGGKQPGDRYTEATASADYLAGRGVPQVAILREVGGRNSWQSLASSAAFLKQRRLDTVLLVSDPFHDKRIALMADELGLKPYVSPTRSSPWAPGPRWPTTSRRRGKWRSVASSGSGAPSTWVIGCWAERRSGPGRRGDKVGPPVRGWCNRQHCRFWPCHWGFESSPPSFIPKRSGWSAAQPVDPRMPTAMAASSGGGQRPATCPVAVRRGQQLRTIPRRYCFLMGNSGSVGTGSHVVSFHPP